jgi:hypothetical protein
MTQQTVGKIEVQSTIRGASIKVKEEFTSSDIFDALIRDRNEAKAIDLLRRFKSTDLLFYRPYHLSGSVTLWHHDGSTYYSKETPLSQLNLL